MADERALTLLTHIGNELKLLWLQMEVWQELFDVKQDMRQALIQATARGFFSTVQFTLAESILMRISRLMDPTKTGKNQNASLEALLLELSDESCPPLCCDIESLLSEWSRGDRKTREEQGDYASLKILRNKWLAHNDQDQRQYRELVSLCIPLTHDDFALAQQLTGRVWSIYRQAHLVLSGRDVVEPSHSCLDDRASVVLKNLCKSQYLDRMLDAMSDEERFARLATLQVFEQEHIGEDRVQPVFRGG